jgi:hypothetical protein
LEAICSNERGGCIQRVDWVTREVWYGEDIGGYVCRGKRDRKLRRGSGNEKIELVIVRGEERAARVSERVQLVRRVDAHLAILNHMHQASFKSCIQLHCTKGVIQSLILISFIVLYLMYCMHLTAGIHDIVSRYSQFLI